MENEQVKQQVPEGLNGILQNNLSPERLQKLQEELGKIEKPKEEEPKPEVMTPPVTELKPEPTPAPEEEKPDPLKESLFFADSLSDEKEIEVTDLRGLATYLKGENIYDIKDETELPKFIESYRELSKRAESFEKSEQRLSQYDNLFTDLPDTLFKAIDKYVRGEDYLAVLKSAVTEKVDFARSFEEQDIKNIIDHYYPNEFSAEDYEEDDNKALKLAKKEAKARFEADRKNYKPYREYTNQQFIEQQKKLKDSASKSYNKLQSEIKVDEARRKEINKILDSGYEGLTSLLFEKDGTWKPEAAEKILFMLYGKQEINAAKLFAQRRSESKLAEEVAAKGKDKPTIKGTSPAPSDKDIEALALKEARRLAGKI